MSIGVCNSSHRQRDKPHFKTFVKGMNDDGFHVIVFRLDPDPREVLYGMTAVEGYKRGLVWYWIDRISRCWKTGLKTLRWHGKRSKGNGKDSTNPNKRERSILKGNREHFKDRKVSEKRETDDRNTHTHMCTWVYTGVYRSIYVYI